MTYEVHDVLQNETSMELLQKVSAFLRHNNASSSFSGTWMLLVQWSEVHPYPHGDPYLTPFYQTSVEKVILFEIFVSTNSQCIIVGKYLPSHHHY